MSYQVHTVQKESLRLTKGFTRIFSKMMSSFKLQFFLKMKSKCCFLEMPPIQSEVSLY